MSVHLRKKDLSSVGLLEISYFPYLGFFEIFVTRFEHLRAEGVTSVQFVNVQ